MKRGIFAAAAAALLWGGALTGALPAGQDNPLARLGDRRAPVEAGALAYARSDGTIVFVLEIQDRRAFLRDLERGEVYALTQNRGSGGAEVLVRDTGEPVLQISRVGGATYFSERTPDGAAVAPVGPAEPLSLAPASRAAVAETAEAMGARLGAMVRQPVSVEVAAADPQTNGLIVETMERVLAAAERGGRSFWRDVTTIRIGLGEAPTVTFEAGVLDISVTPSLGFAGRPSSDLILRALAGDP